MSGIRTSGEEFFPATRTTAQLERDDRQTYRRTDIQTDRRTDKGRDTVVQLCCFTDHWSVSLRRRSRDAAVSVQCLVGVVTFQPFENLVCSSIKRRRCSPIGLGVPASLLRSDVSLAGAVTFLSSIRRLRVSVEVVLWVPIRYVCLSVSVKEGRAPCREWSREKLAMAWRGRNIPRRLEY